MQLVSVLFCSPFREAPKIDQFRTEFDYQVEKNELEIKARKYTLGKWFEHYLLQKISGLSESHQVVYNILLNRYSQASQILQKNGYQKLALIVSSGQKNVQKGFKDLQGKLDVNIILKALEGNVEDLSRTNLFNNWLELLAVCICQAKTVSEGLERSSKLFKQEPTHFLYMLIKLYGQARKLDIEYVNKISFNCPTMCGFLLCQIFKRFYQQVVVWGVWGGWVVGWFFFVFFFVFCCFVFCVFVFCFGFVVVWFLFCFFVFVCVFVFFVFFFGFGGLFFCFFFLFCCLFVVFFVGFFFWFFWFLFCFCLCCVVLGFCCWLLFVVFWVFCFFFFCFFFFCVFCFCVFFLFWWLFCFVLFLLVLCLFLFFFVLFFWFFLFFCFFVVVVWVGGGWVCTNRVMQRIKYSSNRSRIEYAASQFTKRSRNTSANSTAEAQNGSTEFSERNSKTRAETTKYKNISVKGSYNNKMMLKALSELMSWNSLSDTTY
ncbi:Conserved_hypothetical protein [Hexamita inflata]|uniref:Uncharacterized protein n=1 Tax=Hexamita inflata TaxID=28002 RepID=A0AA86N7K6_9EUKA|nr:Conserved hypothetical protein [Hexamita inflata]